MEVHLNKSMHKSRLIVLIVIILVAAIGISAILAYKFFNAGSLNDIVQSQPIVDEQIQELRNLSDSDSVDDIDKDINETKLDKLDLELGQVDSSLSEL